MEAKASGGAQPSSVSGLTKASFLLSAGLLSVWSALELRIGAPPADGAQILEWLFARRTLLAFVSESMFFAAMFLVPASYGLYRWLRRDHPSAAIFGAGSIFVTIPVLLGCLIAHGRLVYPIFQMKVHTPELAELVLAIYYAGLHSVSLVLAGATLLVSLATRRRSRALSALGFVTVVCDVMAAYPDLIGPSLTFAARLSCAAWLAAVGIVASRDLRRAKPFRREEPETQTAPKGTHLTLAGTSGA